MRRIYSVGHGARSLDEFLATLDANVAAIADVRTAPASRRHPHFGREALSRTLEERGILYVHLPGLGGWRRPRPDSPHVALRSAPFRGYADHLATQEFALARERLEQLAAERPTAYLCAETLWWRCHRRILSDRLVAGGWEVVHLLRPGESEPHRLTPGARVVEGELVYDLGSPERLPLTPP